MDDESNPAKPPPIEGDQQPYQVGYKRPPRHARFPKGHCGNPKGRPKRPDGVSLNELFRGVQRTKSGPTISRAELVVRQVLKDAMAGSPREFKKFLDLMERAGLFRQEPQIVNRPIFLKSVPATSTALGIPQAP